MGSGEAPKSVADFNGKTIRGLGGIGEAMKKLGASLKSAPAPEAYELLERGVVWGWSFPYSYTFGAYRLHEISTWYTTNMKLGSNHCPTMVSRKAYAKLPDEWKKLYEEARPLAYKALVQAYDDADKKWIPIYEKMPQLKEVRFSDADLEELKAKGGKPVWDEWVAAREKEGLPGQAVFDAMMAAAAK
jgi:TRAP-type C4-dicarboxylate transport system substrate-binding protein